MSKKAADVDISELAAYEEEDEEVQDGKKDAADTKKDTHIAIQSTGFREFLLKPELLRAIADCGFEHPSEVQHACIPQAVLGQDVICQAKSGMGKTAVFVLSVLQQITPVDKQVSALVLCHTRELAYQIKHEFDRFKKYLGNVKTAVFYGGHPIVEHRKLLKEDTPNIVIGTPGRVYGLAKEGALDLKNCKFFVLDECDKMLETVDMRADVQEIFKRTPHDKQVMMFSATLSDQVKPICKKFMNNVRGDISFIG